MSPGLPARLLVVLPPEENAFSLLDTALAMAERLEWELVALLVEDRRLLASAALPFTRIVSRTGAAEREFDVAATERMLRVVAERARHRLAEVARRRSVRWRFETTRELEAVALGEGDVLAVATASTSWVEEPPARLPCPVLLMGRAGGPLVLVYRGGRTAAELARELARRAQLPLVVLAGDEWPPAPWANVVANPRCGFVATEAGPGFTWCDNSHENRLTPWHNDPVSDPPGEVIYLRHEETGRFWSVTPSPARGSNPYVVAHGIGYTRYTHTSHGIAQELLVFVPPDDPVKLFRLRLQNTSDREQLLSVTFYAEWVLGENRERTQAYLTTAADPETGALLARNVYHPDYPQRVAFADVNRGPRKWTCDRTEFIGRNGSLAAPRALLRAGLGQTAGPKLDACAALQVPLRVPPRGAVEIGRASCRERV